MEEWRQIDGFQDYQVSNLGNVKSFKQDKNGKLLSLKPNATGVIYESITEAARQTNINKSGIARYCKGERKTAGGYHWEKVEG